MNKDKILITAVPRSGTKHVAMLCQNLGLDMPHEVKIGKNGIISWQHIVGVHANDKFGTILHQIRHPLQVVASLATIMVPSWKIIAENIDITAAETMLLRCVKTYVLWNEMIERRANWRYKIEELYTEDVWSEWCHWMNIKKSLKDVPNIPMNFSTRVHRHTYQKVEWDDIKTLGEWGDALIDMAKNYGYLC